MMCGRSAPSAITGSSGAPSRSAKTDRIRLMLSALRPLKSVALTVMKMPAPCSLLGSSALRNRSASLRSGVVMTPTLARRRRGSLRARLLLELLTRLLDREQRQMAGVDALAASAELFADDDLRQRRACIGAASRLKDWVHRSSPMLQWVDGDLFPTIGRGAAGPGHTR